MGNVVYPLRRELMDDQQFTLSIAKVVTARLRQDRANTLSGIAESEIEVSREAVPMIAGDLTKEQMLKVDSVMRVKYGENWFKDRRTHPSSIPSNTELQSCILTAFYAGNLEFIALVEGEAAIADESAKRVVVDPEMMQEFFSSANGFRHEAWAGVEGRYSLTRERLQRKVRSKRHREKKKDQPMGSDASGGDGSEHELDGSVETGKSRRNKPGTQAGILPKISSKSTGLREDPSIPPLNSVNFYVKHIVDDMKVLSDAKKQIQEKIERLSGTFHEVAVELEKRVGVQVLNQEAEFCFTSGLLHVIAESLPLEVRQVDRLKRLTKDLSSQGAISVEEPKHMTKSLRLRIGKLLDDQRDVVGQFVKCWLAVDPKALAKNSALLESRARSIADEGGKIVGAVEELLGTFDRAEVLWFFGRMSEWYARSCVISKAVYKGSSLKRMEQLLSTISGTFI